MTDIEILKAPVKEEYLQYKNYYKNALKSNIKILDFISGFIHSRKENEIVPLLTLLSAKATGNITDQTYTAASIIDFLSTATIIHNEVEDEDVIKKDIFKIKTLWKGKLAVLMGDYFLAKGLLLSVKNKTYNLLEIISKSVKEITEGELYNTYYSRKLLLTKPEYIDIINKKSSSLMSACASIGAISTGAEEDKINALRNFGKNFGIAHHIKTDLKNLSGTRTKSINSFPLIIALENASETRRNDFVKTINNSTEVDYSAIKQFIKSNGGDEGSKLVLNGFINQAKEDLNTVKGSKAKEALISLLRA